MSPECLWRTAWQISRIDATSKQFVVENDNCLGGLKTPPNKMIPVSPGRSEE
jgi:hypothetical protein